MARKEKKKIESRIELPEGIKVEFDGVSVSLSGKYGSVKKKISPMMDLEIKDKEIILSAKKKSRTYKKIAGSYTAHINNMIKGVREPYKYILKICSGHFPMNVSVKNDEFIVKNFLGEKIPRVLKLKKDVKVKVEADLVIVESVDKELAGQVAADIEKLCKITNRDSRIFQDGIWITSKAGKSIK